MRILLYVVILGLLFLAPVEQLDVAKLEPVQTISLRFTDGEIELETDTGNKGRGKNIADAVNDLEEKTPGVVYLDTAQYLLVTEEASPYVETLRHYLQTEILVSMWDGSASVKSAAKYLDIRRDLPKLRDWKTAEKKIDEK